MKKLQTKLAYFLRELFKPDGGFEEKTVVGFSSFAIMVIQALSNLYFGFKVEPELFLTFAGLTGACFGMTTNAFIKTQGMKSDVASDIVKEGNNSSANQTAKEIVKEV